MPDINNEELIKQIKNGINVKQNYEQLYKQNRGFIYQVIRKRVHGIYECDDLMQQSFIALVKAVDYYNFELQETNFLQILKYCIWNEIRNITSELPVHMQYKIIDYRKNYDRLYNELGYKPKAYQIMLEMNISQKELEIIRAAMRAPVSLDEPIGEDGDATRLALYASSTADDDNDFDSNVENQDLRRLLQEALSRLPEASSELIEKRYFKNFTLEKCGQELNVSRERVRQLEVKAFRKLRKDHELRKQVEGYISEYKHVGVNQFNNTRTSSTECVVLEIERRLEEWKRQRYKEQLQGIEGFENIF